MICGTNLPYDSEKHYRDVAPAILKYLRNPNAETEKELKDFIESVFRKEDAVEILTWIANNPGKMFPRNFGVKRDTINLQDSIFLESRPVKTVLEYFADYGGNPNSDAEDLQTSLNTELVFRLVYNPKDKQYFHPNQSDVAHIGYTNVNRKLRELKAEIADRLIKSLGLKEVPYNLDNDIEFTGFINYVLINAQSELEKRRILKRSIPVNIRKDFVQLACFNELLRNSGFISIENDNNIESKDRYLFSGETIDVKGSQYEEHADAEKYTSKLVKIILDSIKSIGTNETIGLKGFQTAMSYVTDWALSGRDKIAFNLITDPNSVNYKEIIRLYLKRGIPPKKVRRALSSISTSLFADDVPEIVKNLFTAQSLTTCKSIYFEYTLGTLTRKQGGKTLRSPAIVCKRAEDKILDESKWEVVETILSKLGFYNSNREAREKVERRYNVVDRKTNSFKFTPWTGAKPITVTYDSVSKTFNWDCNYETHPNWNRVVTELLDIPLPSNINDVLREVKSVTKVGNEELPNLISPFKSMLCMILWNLETIDAKFKKSNGDINIGSLFKVADTAGVVVNQIFEDEFKEVVKNINGDTIPTHQMTSLGYRTKYLIAGINRTDGHVKKDNFWVRNSKNLGATVLREGVDIGATQKESAGLGVSEVEQLAIITDFYTNLFNPQKSDNSDIPKTSIFLQPLTYSDKTRHILKEIILSELKLSDGTNVLTTLQKLAKAFGESAREYELAFEREINFVRGSEARKSLVRKLGRFAKALDIDYNLQEDDASIDDAIEAVNTKLASYSSIESLREAFRSKGQDLYEENDIDFNGERFRLNSLHVFWYNTFGKNKSEDYINAVKMQFAFDLLEDGFQFNKYLDPALQGYFSEIGNNGKSWINSFGGTMKLFKLYDSTGKEISSKGVDLDTAVANGYRVELNPILNGFFYANMLFGEQIRTVQMGADYNIATKGFKDTEADIATRFVAASKRAMGQGSTVMKYDTTKKYGVANKAEYAVFEDQEDIVYNPKGYNKKGKYKAELVQDGGGYISPIQFVLEQWSLPGNVKTRGDIVKSIMQSVDEHGNLIQIKWAGNTISNLRRRGAPDSEGVNLDQMFRLMHSKHKIVLDFDLAQFYGPNVYFDGDRSITCTEKLYYKDINTGKYYRIDSVTTDPASRMAVRTTTEVDSNGNVVGATQTWSFKIDSLYDLHELFGGKYCKAKVKNELVYTELNNEILATIVCAQNIRDKFVHYVVNKSANKVGMNNVNAEDVFYSNAGDVDLWTNTMEMQHSGMQLDAGHEVKGGEVTEMSQLVALLIEKGFATDLIDDIYGNIASVTKSGLTKFEDKNKVKTVISEILAESLKSNSNLATITDDFIHNLTNRVKTEGINLELPFSSPTIKSKFATAICATINTAALRRRYPGLGAVQSPSYDVMCNHIIGGYNYTYEQTIDSFRKSLNDNGITDVNYLFNDPNAIKGYVTNEYVTLMQNVKNQYGDSVVERIIPSYIDFEDTVIYRENGVLKVKKIKHISDYYALKYSGIEEMYRWNTKPRNLVQQLTQFQISIDPKEKFNIYDLDESRAIQYLSAYKHWINTPEAPAIEEFLKGMIPEFRLATSSAEFFAKDLHKSAIRRLQDRLQDTLRDFRIGTTVSINGQPARIIKTWNKPADIMMGNPWKDIFHMRDDDALGDILREGPEWFRQRLRDTYRPIPPTEVPISGYDAVLYEADGTPILIQFGAEENFKRLDSSKLKPGSTFSKSTGKLRYKGEDLGDINGIAEFTYTSTTNKSYKVLRIKDSTRINAFLKSKLFTELQYHLSDSSNFAKIIEFVYKNKVRNGIATKTFYIGEQKILKGTNLNKLYSDEKYHKQLKKGFNDSQTKRLNRKFDKLSIQQFHTFDNLLNVIGTRIPSQSLQSCAACRIVGFTGSKTNDVYLPRILTWCAGSDYDIDKFFIMMNGCLENGIMPNLKGITNPNYDPAKLSQLPDAPGVEFDITVESTIKTVDEFGDVVIEKPNRTDAIYVSKSDIYAVNNGGELGIEVLTRIVNEFRKKNASEIVLLLDENETTATEEGNVVNAMFGSQVYEIEDIVDKDLYSNVLDFIDTVNEYSTNDISSYGKFYREMAEKNAVMNKIFEVLTSPATQLGLQTPVSMDEAHAAVEKRGVDSKSHLNPDNPRSIFKQQVDNMVGKIGIASVAVAQKAFNGISYSFDSIVLECSKTYGTMNVQEWLERLMSTLIETKDDGGYMSLANINFRPLMGKGILIPINSVSLTEDQIKRFTRIGVLKDGVIDIDALATYLQARVDRTDGVDLFSNIMSAATDNAKELLLSKLNAVGDNLDLYTYLFATGHTFDEAADIIMSPVFRLVSKYSEKNVFMKDSSRINNARTIDFLTGRDHLPTVDKKLINSILGWTDRNIDNEVNITKRSTFFSYLLKHDKTSFDAFKKLVKSLFTSFDINSDLVDTLRFVSENATAFSSKTDGSNFTRIQTFVMNQLGRSEVQLLLTGDPESENDDGGWLGYWISVQKSKDSLYSEEEVNDSDYDEYEDADYNSSFSGYFHKESNDYTKASSDELSHIYNYLQMLYQKEADLTLLKESGLNVVGELETLTSLTKSANEFATLGRKIFSINQGMRVGDYEEWKWVDNIEVEINRAFLENLKEFEVFDFVRFVNDSTYADKMIEQYKKCKQTVNILQVFLNCEHYVQMVKSALTARNLLEQSTALKMARKIARRLKLGAKSNSEWIENYDPNSSTSESITRTLSNDEWRRISNVINEHLIFNFFTHLDNDKASFKVGDGQIEKGYAMVNDSIKTTDASGKTFKLNTIEGICTFIRWMDTYYIPKLKREMSGNSGGKAFADALCQIQTQDSRFKDSKTHWALNKRIHRAKPGETLYKNRSEVVTSFGSIMRNPSELEGFTIGDLFYIYNILNYKDGSSGMTFLFSDAAATGNTSDWVDAFQQYVADLDHGKITADGEFFDITPEDVLFGLIDENNGYKFGVNFNATSDKVITPNWTNKSSSVSIDKPQFLSNSDFPFSIPSIYKNIGKSVWTGFNPFTPMRGVKITGQEVLHQVITKLNPMLQSAGINIIEVTDSDLERWDEENSKMFEDASESKRNHIRSARGFVYNGDIYINVSDKKSDSLGDHHEMISTLMHECVHLICANLHYNPKYKDAYIATIRQLWNKAQKEVKEKYINTYPGKKTTDLMEEYFANLIGDAFATNFSEKFQDTWEKAIGKRTITREAISAGQLKHDVSETLMNVFGLNDSIENVDFSVLGGSDITDLMYLFESVIFNFNRLGFTRTNVALTQELATLKSKLWKENKIIEKC